MNASEALLKHQVAAIDMLNSSMSKPARKPLPLVKFSSDLQAYLRDEGMDQDFIAEILEASQKPSIIEIGLGIINVIETWQDCLQDAIMGSDECSLCHGSGGAVEHHCMSCHGSGKRRSL